MLFSVLASICLRWLFPICFYLLFLLLYFVGCILLVLLHCSHLVFFLYVVLFFSCIVFNILVELIWLHIGFFFFLSNSFPCGFFYESFKDSVFLFCRLWTRTCSIFLRLFSYCHVLRFSFRIFDNLKKCWEMESSHQSWADIAAQSGLPQRNRMQVEKQNGGYRGLLVFVAKTKWVDSRVRTVFSSNGVARDDRTFTGLSLPQ